MGKYDHNAILAADWHDLYCPAYTATSRIVFWGTHHDRYDFAKSERASMTRDDIISWAREAGLIKDWMVLRNEESDALARFAALVSAAEREACLALVVKYRKGYIITAAIRERGQS
jgi:hypothetical protein